MARPKPKIPRINFAEIKFDLDDQQWREVEDAFGRTLDTQTGQEIATATGQFLQFAQAEKNTGSMADAIGRAERFRKYGFSLLDMIDTTAGAFLLRLERPFRAQGHATGDHRQTQCGSR
jgi:hypothetical protein